MPLKLGGYDGPFPYLGSAVLAVVATCSSEAQTNIQQLLAYVSISSMNPVI